MTDDGSFPKVTYLLWTHDSAEPVKRTFSGAFRVDYLYDRCVFLVNDERKVPILVMTNVYAIAREGAVEL